ncbi:MAG: NUDIX domain-containing protein [Nanoarchaeota archaeon]|nr:NUDIX domain-containing protein [Nanoarchaeota archaeon]
MEKDGAMQVAVDAVVFTNINNILQILLIKRKYPPYQGSYAIPGGFVKPEEALETAAQRELYEETGVKNIYLQQLGAYGNPKRDPRGRVLSVAFLALINAEQKLEATTDASVVQWFSIDELPPLAFDHKTIIEDALQQLRYELQTTNIAFQILPKRFTLTQLQALYETVLNKQLDKRNFRKRIKELHIVKATTEQQREGAHRPALLYTFINQTYTPIREKINVFL